MIFRTFGIFLMFLGFVSMVIRKNDRFDRAKWHSFVKREGDANKTLPQDISQLDYVDFSGVTLPFAQFNDNVLKECEEQVLALRSEKVLNLNGISNTDLKLQYGVANLGKLMAYDQNFIMLVRTLNQWGHRLYELEQYNEAKTVLLFAVSIGSDIKATYELLLRLYQEAGELSGIQTLKSSAEKLTSIRKDSILKMLEDA